MKQFGIAVAILLATVVAACGGDDGEGAAKNASTDGGEKAAKLEGSISVWIMDPGSPKIQGVVKQYGTDFEAAHPGTKVDIQFVPWAQAHDKFVTAIAGGKVPDVAEMGTTWTPEFADQGALLEQPEIAKDDYVSSLVDAATLDGKVYGKPWYAGARSLIYRKDLLEKAGVEPPKTWDDMEAAAKAIKAKDKGVYPVGFTGLSEHMYLPTIWQAGGEIATQDGDTWKSALNSPEAAQALDWYASFYKDGYVPKAAIGWEEPDAQTAFINGDIAMLIAGGWGYNSIIATKPELEEKIGTALTPTGPSGKGTAFAGGSHLVQFTESGNHDLGAAFVDFMLEPDQLNKFTSEIGFLPGTTAGIQASGYLEDEQRKPFAEQLLNASAVYPPSPKWGGLEGANIFDGQIQKVMKGEETGQQAAANLATKMDEEFAG
ncbi:carbohydrate ABC transporter substrate-binding protein (CUT1 family) [Solirubrobacter pauli]|uniref:Carbohydrate ABC transporter substrate-binding protein (CUT1 family) n=1 Tax=Solirubrobacter pauli TaxID=166793 RepID=A0A660L156_9ACTN|nr:extracellular solute-binding protein [Solirubrobacter pauli]RKQ87721.1 carbohydrate ABC transporter substrate-binding protein (CUT1 family) [Solirubrobacter pauli]